MLRCLFAPLTKVCHSVKCRSIIGACKDNDPHLDYLLNMLPRLLLTSPQLQLLPVYALMLHPKTVHPIDLLVDDFKRRVTVTHESLP